MIDPEKEPVADRPSPMALPLTFDEARLAQLREFAKTTPQQRLDWLGEMLEFMQALRANRGRGRGPDESNSNRLRHSG